MNKGLSDMLKIEFPNIIPVLRPSIELPQIIDNNWIAGFTDAECCFYVKLSNSKTTKTGKVVSLVFNIAQHSRDALLLAKLRKPLGCGNFIEDSKTQVCIISITKLSDLLLKIIPLFNEYPLQGSKKLDFMDFFNIAELLKNKAHFSEQGLDLILKIKNGMNKGR